MEITEDILILLYDNDAQITKAVVQAALCNISGKRVVGLLFKRDGVQITAALVEEAVHHSRICVEMFGALFI